MNKNARVKPQKLRNRNACHPIMRKGGVHTKSKKADRSAQKLSLKREYLGENQASELSFSKVFSRALTPMFA